MELRERVLVSELCFCRTCSFFFLISVRGDLDIDECAMNTHNCNETVAKCLNTPAGTFTCMCIAGHTGNGTTGTCVGE